MSHAKIYNADPTIQVGDYVFSHYSKKDMWVYKVTKVTRRYLLAEDIKQHPMAYADCNPGEEMNPYLTLEKVCDLSFKPAKKVGRKVTGLDAAWVKKVDKKEILDHILRLQSFIDRL